MVVTPPSVVSITTRDAVGKRNTSRSTWMISGTSVTLIVNVLSNVLPAESVTRTVTLCDVLVSKSSRLPLATIRVEPLIPNRPSAESSRLNVKLSPECSPTSPTSAPCTSGSSADSSPTTVPLTEFSGTLAALSEISVGAAFGDGWAS